MATDDQLGADRSLAMMLKSPMLHQPTPATQLACEQMAGDKPKRLLRNALRRAGFEIKKHDPEGTYAKRRQRLLESERVDLVLDVGAHAGEFGQALRHEGYKGRIVSFEPVRSHHERLQALAAADGNWTCRRAAVGDRSGEVEIHISGNDGFSSSVRKMAAVHEAADPSSSYVGSEMVEMTTLDRLVGEVLHPEDRAFLKVDTQGFESEVLAGAARALDSCHLVELELVLVELYDRQAQFAELVDQMLDRGFVLTDVESGFRDERTSQLLQIDGIFVRSSA